MLRPMARGHHNLRYWLGEAVLVEIDRPMGSVHPRLPDLIYPVNYGFLPGTRAPDNHPVDAYVLGPEGPIQSFQGKCIAVIERSDDIESKLVVADSKSAFSERQIRELTWFQEQYFQSKILCLKSISI